MHALWLCLRYFILQHTHHTKCPLPRIPHTHIYKRGHAHRHRFSSLDHFPFVRVPNSRMKREKFTVIFSLVDSRCGDVCVLCVLCVKLNVIKSCRQGQKINKPHTKLSFSVWAKTYTHAVTILPSSPPATQRNRKTRDESESEREESFADIALKHHFLLREHRSL